MSGKIILLMGFMQLEIKFSPLFALFFPKKKPAGNSLHGNSKSITPKNSRARFYTWLIRSINSSFL